MKTKIIATATLCAALLTTAAAPAYAETTSTTTPAEGRAARLEANRELACERVTQRVADQKAKIEERAAATQARYEKQDERLSELAAKANEQGIDTTELEGYLAVWEGYTDDIKDKRVDVKANIESAVALICDGDREGGRTAFEDAKAIIDEIKDIKLERRQYWVNTIVPELKSIRDELRTLRTSAS